MFRPLQLRSVPTASRHVFAARQTGSPRAVLKARTGNTPSPNLRWRLFSTVASLRSADSDSGHSSFKGQQSRLRRFVGTTFIAVVAFSAGFLYQTQRTISRLMAAPTPLDDDVFVPTDDVSLEVENFIHNHPLAVSLRENPDFSESRPHTVIPEGLRPRSLTAGTLAGPEKIVVPPYIYSETGGKSLVSIFYLGSDLCGHPGIVHGGLLATLLDEGLARCCFPALPNKVAVTANLNIDYRRPAMASSYHVLRAETVKVEGRKAWVEGRIETLPEEGEEPVTLAEAKALFIEPKQAAAMASVYKVEP